ncbi:MAG: hypothetical protein Q8P91_02145, partial [bacterium]|nr:hypothetical protein [bacterium]
AWKKVIDLACGMKIAFASTSDGGDIHSGSGRMDSPGVIEFDEIVSIKKAGRERVWDIEIEGTHNFVGNGILAHNTYVSGNVGIGTTSPSEKLHVNGKISFERTAGDESNAGKIDYRGFDGGALSIVGAGTASGERLVRIFDKMTIGSGFSAAPTNGLTVQGNVGIGTTSPGTKLDILETSNNAGEIKLTNTNLTTGNQAQLTLSAENASNVALAWSIINYHGSDGSLNFYDGTQDLMRVQTGASGNILGNNTFSSGAFDLAENVLIEDTGIESGDIVIASPTSNPPNWNQKYNAFIAVKAQIPYAKEAIGIISEKPGFLMRGYGFDEESQVDPNFVRPLSLSGRVPVKVSTINGSIKAGDPITTSEIPGVGMKATKAGQIVGKALADYNNPDPNVIGKIMAFVNLSWYDPDVYLTSTGDLKITATITATSEESPTGTPSEETFRLINKAGEMITRIGAFGEVIAANIKTGAIIAKEGFIEGGFKVADTIIAGAVETKKLISPVVQTDLISPLADSSDVVIKLGKQNTSSTPEESKATSGVNGGGEESSGFGKLIIQNPQGEEVASIDSSGSAEFKNASVSGELYAGSIVSPDLDKIQELLRQVKVDQDLLTQAASWNANTAASNAATLSELAISNLFVTGQAAINSLSVLDSFAVGSDFVINYTNTNTPEESKATSGVNTPFRVSINTLSAPLSLQSLALAPVEIMAGKIKIDTEGNVTVAGNMAIAGDLEVKGKTKLGEVQIEKLVIANTNTSEESPAGTPSEVSPGVIDTNATVGSAKIASGSAEIIINNPNISDNTLVYVTPTSTTNNNVLFVKSKEIGKFIVGFTDPLDINVSFNWWIIEIK